MGPSEVIARWLADSAPDARLVILGDSHGLLDQLDPPGWTVWFAESNLRFRLDWRGRDRAARHLVVRRRAEVFTTDLEAVASLDGLVLDVTPRGLLALGSGHDDWPAWLDREPALVNACFRGLTRARRRLRTPTPDELEEMVVRAVLGFDPAQTVEPADAWQALYERAPLLAGLQSRRCPLAVRLRDWLSRQPAPLCWVDLSDPQPAARLTWLVALLGPHVANVGEELPRIYPGAARLAGVDATAVARVAYRLASANRKLAASQQALAEAALTGPLRAALCRALRIEEIEVAALVVRRELRCGPLALMALRVLLEACATDRLADDPRLECDLDSLDQRADELSESRAVRAHARLLRALLRLDRGRHRLTAPRPEEGLATRQARALAWMVDTEIDTLGQDAVAAAQALTRNSVAEPGWRPRPDAGRHKAVLRSLYHRVELAREALAGFEGGCREAWLALSGLDGEHQVDGTWDYLVKPLLAEPDQPRVTVLLVAGLPWRAWGDCLAGPLAEVSDCHVRAVAASLPAAAEESLRRAVAAGLSEGESWPKLLRTARPELALRTCAVPRALAGLAEEGCVAHAAAGGQLRLVAVNLLAGPATGVPVERWRRRLDLLAEAGVALARSRRAEVIVLLGTSGAVRCREAAGLSLSGQVLAPRCVAADGQVNERDDVLEMIVGGRRLWCAMGADRLAPAAREAVMADGGLSLDEMVVPCAVLSPVPVGERATVLVGGLAVPDPVPAGRLVEAAVVCTLTGGALAELAQVRLELPGAKPVSATLDLGEPKRLTVPFRLNLPPGIDQRELTLEAEIRVGRRVFRRRAPVTVTSALWEECRPPTPISARRLLTDA
ncbi:MAG: hypothetical protein HZB16_14755 [Armatimonadetes bacterium]|nr:hypothetical protein [Armatimonadota bacterium]